MFVPQQTRSVGIKMSLLFHYPLLWRCDLFSQITPEVFVLVCFVDCIGFKCFQTIFLLAWHFMPLHINFPYFIFQSLSKVLVYLAFLLNYCSAKGIFLRLVFHPHIMRTLIRPVFSLCTIPQAYPPVYGREQPSCMLFF